MCRSVKISTVYRMSRTLVVGLAALAFGCSRQDPVHRVVALAPVASVEVPFSDIDEIALVRPDIVCVADSFEVRVECRRRTGETTGVFGRKGEGPGEFSSPNYLHRGPSETLRVFDLGLQRVTVFEPTGTLKSETALPGLFAPTAAGDSTVFGYYANVSTPGRIPAEVDLTTGAILWERPGGDNVAVTECGRVGAGLPAPGGGYVFRACTNELVWLAHRDDDRATVVTSPSYIEQFPDQRDIDAYLAFSARLASQGSGRSVAPEAFEPYAEAYKETPKPWFQGRQPLAFDVRGRLWVATTLDRDAYSYFDLWIGTEYAGMVRVRDRLLGYDLMGTSLATLVERAPTQTGIAKRAVDWYDISVLDTDTHPE